MAVKGSNRKRSVVHLKCKAPKFAWYLNERRWFFPVHPFLSCDKPLSLIEEAERKAAENGFCDAMLKLWHLYFYLYLSSFPPNLSIFSRKIVEHVCLLKAKHDLSEEEENDMLGYLYTTQYQMGGVVAISLGRISSPNPERYTHALFMRFQKKENLEKFYENPFYMKVLKDYVMTYCHGLTNVDYESEVADEMLSIFRKGEEFNHGVEFVLLISFNEDALGNQAEHALASLASMMLESPSLIVQFTHGLNLSPSSKEYTHGVVIRFRSVEAFEIFINSKEYKNVWHSKFQPIVHKSFSLHFSVDPVGTEIM
ncbi:uncharacterized protein [Glycine max]|uniref:uncharacterized protein isoform X1 n=1 Tax=Glycine max TaxID=3847 RepID=UPI00023382A9|nr:uncharacterized protein LOC100807996 isoform X1 [Glycine max]|eukprot:XP_014634111.1 uncharacterized protein LOC100807996 isoform X1 [Glycine max]